MTSRLGLWLTSEVLHSRANRSSDMSRVSDTPKRFGISNRSGSLYSDGLVTVGSSEGQGIDGRCIQPPQRQITQDIV